jgi:ankyrin repeat protein
MRGAGALLTIVASASIAMLRPVEAQDRTDRSCIAPAASSSAAAIDVDAFFEAVLLRNSAVVRTALAGGFDPQQRDQYGNSALHWAAIIDSAELVDSLTRCGADLEARAELTGITPLLMAIDHESTEAIAALLLAGADAAAKVTTRELNQDLRLTAIDLAARRDRMDIVQVLVEHGAPVAGSDSHALRYAVRNRNTQLVRYLLAHGARHPSMTAAGPGSLVDEVVRRRDADLAETLISHGATTADPTSTLSNAAASPDERMFRAVLDLRPELNRLDSSGATPLIVALEAKNLPMVDELLNRGAQPALVTRPPERLEYSPPPRGIDSARTALSAAASSGLLDMVVRIQSLPGFTCDMFGAALMAAATLPSEQAVPIAKLLLERRECFAPESEGLSAAMLRAVEAHQVHTASVLLESGASFAAIVDGRYSSVISEPIGPPQPRGNNAWFRPGPSRFAGYTAVSPLELAVAMHDLPMLRFLVGAGASLTRDIHGADALHALAQPRVQVQGVDRDADLVALVRFLLDNGAQINARDDQQMTPLMRAAEWGSLNLVNALMLAGADTKLRNTEGLDAATLATERRHASTARLLRGQTTLAEARAADSNAQRMPFAQPDALAKAVCITRPEQHEPFAIGRSGVAAVHPKFPITPFAGYLAVDIALDASNKYPSAAARARLVEEILHAIAIWHIVCPNCEPWTLAVAHVDGQAFMIEECYREIRDHPNRKRRRPGIPQRGESTALWGDAFASCSRRFSMGRGLENTQWKYLALTAQDPVRKIACGAPELHKVATALGCAKPAATPAPAAPVARIAVGFTHENTSCKKDDPKKVIACTRLHHRVDLNARDFSFTLPGYAERFGSGPQPKDLSRVLLHEVGHWLGLTDWQGGENIMSPSFSNARCISNENLDMLSDPLNQALWLHTAALEALIDD